MREAISLCACAIVSVAFLSSGQNGSIANAQSTKQSSESQSSASKPAAVQPPSDQKTSASHLKQLAQEHKVITTDDLESSHSKEQKQFQFKKINDQISRDPASCDAECASEAREYSGMGQELEGEWQSQFIAAKHYLSIDAQWRYAYTNGLQKAQMYCALQDQLRKAPPPSGNDYRSRVERAKQQQYADDMNRTLSVSLQGINTQMNILIEDAQKNDPVRAAIMTVLAQRIFSQCPDLYFDP